MSKNPAVLLLEHHLKELKLPTFLRDYDSVGTVCSQERCDYPTYLLRLWTVVINRIPLHARFRLSNNVLVPAFASNTDVELPLIWHAPKEVRLAFAVRTEAEGDCVRVCGNWLFACDGDNRGYRLPLPNLHDDCLICTGNFAEHHATGQECVTASLEQFRKSKWNADLMRTIEKSQQFFRFQPTNDTFETLPIAVTDWTSLCDKVSTHIMERVIL